MENVSNHVGKNDLGSDLVAPSHDYFLQLDLANLSEGKTTIYDDPIATASFADGQVPYSDETENVYALT